MNLEIFDYKKFYCTMLHIITKLYACLSGPGGRGKAVRLRAVKSICLLIRLVARLVTGSVVAALGGGKPPPRV